MRTNNGGEYTRNKLKDLCKQAGIKELTVPYNPQQNGVAKRKNKAIIGATKENNSWLGFAHVSLGKRMQHDKTPDEEFTRVRPEIDYFRIFGCLVYVHVPLQKRTNLVQ